MFFHILLVMQADYSWLRIFQYISFRVGLAAVVAFLLCVFIAPVAIRKMQRMGVIDSVREDGPETHKHKAPTPSMGGLFLMPSIIITTLLFARLDLALTWIVVGVTTWMGITGLIDDYLKKTRSKSGMKERYKLLSQLTISLIVGCIIYFKPELISNQFAAHVAETTVPFFKNLMLSFAPFGFGVIYLFVVLFIITGTSNAVNLTDGLDGLAIGIVSLTSLGLGVLAYVSGNTVYSDYLNIVYLPGSGELSVFCAALVGAGLGFLWFNAPPASVYGGDGFSLSTGAALATVAILIKKELFLPLLGGIFVWETISVLLQRYYFKFTRKKYGQGRRIFRMAPYHHHLELSGWAETKIVVRFWIISIILLFLTLMSFKVR